MIVGSKGKLGQLEGVRKSDRKPPKIVAQGTAATAPVFGTKGCDVERENRGLGFVIFAEFLCVKIVNY